MCNIFSAPSLVTAQILSILQKNKMCCQEIEKSKCETMTNYFRSKMIVFDTWKQWTQKENCEKCETRGMCNNLEWRSNGENFTSKTIHHHQTTTLWKQRKNNIKKSHQPPIERASVECRLLLCCTTQYSAHRTGKININENHNNTQHEIEWKWENWLVQKSHLTWF